MTVSVLGPINSGVAAGGAGVATANQSTGQPIVGKFLGVYLRYNDSPPAGTTDVTIKTAGGTCPSYNLLKITNGATDGLYLVKQDSVHIDNSGNTDDGALIPISDKITVLIEGANNGDSVDAWLFMEK